MDIGSLLPLLIQQKGVGNERLGALLRMAQGEKPDLGSVMQMAMTNKNRSGPMGLAPVIDIACYEITGKLTKFFLTPAVR